MSGQRERPDESGQTSGQTARMTLEVSQTTIGATAQLVHCNPSAFPSHIGWYQLLESEVFQEDGRIRVYRAELGEDWVVLPLIRNRGSVGGIRLEALQNYYTPDFRPFCSSSDSRKLICELIRRAAVEEKAYRFSLRPLDPEAPETHEIRKGLSDSGWKVVQTLAFGNWVYAVKDGLDYERYVAERSSRTRSTLRRKKAQLESLGNLEIVIHRDAENMDQLLQSYEAIYAQRAGCCTPLDCVARGGLDL